MTDRRALITGITGQDGSYLAELLLDKGYGSRHGPPLEHRDVRAHRPPAGPDRARPGRPARPGSLIDALRDVAAATRSTTWPPELRADALEASRC